MHAFNEATLLNVFLNEYLIVHERDGVLEKAETFINVSDLFRYVENMELNNEIKKEIFLHIVQLNNGENAFGCFEDNNQKIFIHKI